VSNASNPDSSVNIAALNMAAGAYIGGRSQLVPRRLADLDVPYPIACNLFPSFFPSFHHKLRRVFLSSQDVKKCFQKKSKNRLRTPVTVQSFTSWRRNKER
jgi:hypothetical protein